MLGEVGNKVRRLDAGFWDALKAQGAEMAAGEPHLAALAQRCLIEADGFGAAIATRLALLLASAEMGEEELRAVFAGAIEASPSIMMNAVVDLGAVVERDPACHKLIQAFMFFKGWQALQAHRIAHHYWQTGQKDLAYFIQSRVSAVTSVDIHPATQIGKGIMIDHAHDVVLGETCVIEDNVSLMQGVTLGGNGKETGDRHPKIRQGVLVGAGAKVLGNIEIGRGSRVAAGSVVLHSVPPNTTVAGIPARIVGTSGSSEPARAMDHQIEPEDG